MAHMTGNAPKGSGAISSYFGNKIWGMRVVDLRLLWTLEIRDVIFSYVSRYFKQMEALESNRLKHVVKRIASGKIPPVMPNDVNQNKAENLAGGGTAIATSESEFALGSRKYQDEKNKVSRRASASNRRASLNTTTTSSLRSPSINTTTSSARQDTIISFGRKDNKGANSGTTTPGNLDKDKKDMSLDSFFHLKPHPLATSTAGRSHQFNPLKISLRGSGDTTSRER